MGSEQKQHVVGLYADRRGLYIDGGQEWKIQNVDHTGWAPIGAANAAGNITMFTSTSTTPSTTYSAADLLKG